MSKQNTSDIPEVSIVIPVYNEEESLPVLYQELEAVLQGTDYEVISIDDGSSDSSWVEISNQYQKNPRFIGIRFRRNQGKSAALQTGFNQSKGKVVITMDADLQDNPNEIPELMRMINEDNFDLVSGWKKIRKDPLSKRLPSKLFNKVTQWVSGIPLHDFNCGLKAYRNQLIKSIFIQGEMHRYIPVIAKQAGFKNIGEKVVEHRKRSFGSTKFGPERFLNGFFDLLTVSFVSKFQSKPMHFFGLWGVISFLLGFFSAVILGIQKMIQLQNHDYGHLLTDSVWFYISLTLMIIGSQLFLAGYLGELISRQKPINVDSYIDEVLH